MKRINFIPEEARRESTKNRIKKYFLKSGFFNIAIVSILLLLSVFVYNVSAAARYRLKVSLLNKEIKKVEQDMENKRQIQAQLNKELNLIVEENKYIEKRLSFLEGTKKEAIGWSGILQVLNKFTPANLWLSKISLKKELITLSGTTLNNADVSDFMLSLDETGNFKETSFNFTQKNKEKKEEPIIDFEVTTHPVIN